MDEQTIGQAVRERGIDRRGFLKFCSIMAGTLALPSGQIKHIVRALETNARVPLIWLEFQDCAGCTEALLRSSRPTVAELVLNILSVDYHETIMAASGFLAEEAKKQTIDAGGYLLVVEGSIPKGEDGIYCCIGGRTAEDILQEAAANALAVVAVGNCATFGGIPKANPNPTGAVSVTEMLKDLGIDKAVVNLSGCPYNPVNLTATVVHFLTFGELPAMDDKNRPLFAYGARIHDNCERRGHFDAGEFVKAWGDEGHKKGWCLYEMGCKGPVTYHNCPAVRYNDGTSWPVKAGHGCIGCSEPDFWDFDGGVYGTAKLFEFAPPDTFAPVTLPEAKLDPTSAAIIGGATGLALGAAATAAYRQLSKSDQEEPDEDGEE